MSVQEIESGLDSAPEVAAPVNDLGAEPGSVANRLARLTPKQRALLDLRLKDLHGGEPEAADPLPEADGDRHPVSFGQQRLWFVDQLEPGNSFFNLALAVRLLGKLSVAGLRTALGAAVRRHEALRTVFVNVDGEPRQRIEPPRPIGLPSVDVSRLVEGEAWATRCVEALGRLPFDLAKGPLLRCLLIRLAPRDHVLALSCHHIASDWLSLRLLVRESSAAYAALGAGRPSPLPELRYQYRHFVAWQRRELERGLDEERKYWRGQLTGAPTFIALPTDRARPAVRTYRGTRLDFPLDPGVAAPLRAYAARTGISLFTLFLAAYQTLLALETGQPDVVVSAPVAERTRREFEGLIGFFVNTLLFRLDLSGDPSFDEVLGRAARMVQGAFAHPNLPLEVAIGEVAPDRSLGHNPLLQVGMNWIEDQSADPQLSDLRLEMFPYQADQMQFELNLVVRAGSAGIHCFFEYQTDLFSPAAMAALGARFARLLAALGEAPDRRLSVLAERAEIAPAERPASIEGFALSPAQRRLWSLGAGDPGSPYSVSLRVAIESATPWGLAGALARLVTRWEILRSRFVLLAGLDLPLQSFTPTSALRTEPIAVVALEGLPEASSAAVVDAAFGAFSAAPFAPRDGLVYRAAWLSLGGGRGHLLLAASALVADSFSLRLLAAEIESAAAGLSRATDEPFQYADFAQYQNDREASAEGAEERRLWASFGGTADGSPVAVGEEPSGFYPRRRTLRLAPNLAASLHALAEARKSGIAAVVLAAWQGWLDRLALAPNGLAVILPGRSFEELRFAVGPYARGVRWPGRPAMEVGLAANVDLAARDLERTEELCTGFVAPPGGGRMVDAVFEFVSGAPVASRSHAVLEPFRCLLRVSDPAPASGGERGIDLEFGVAAELSTVGGGESPLERFLTFLAASVAAPDRPLDSIELRTPGEIARMVALNATERKRDSQATLPELVARTGNAFPDRIALVAGDRALTYGELLRQVERCARRLVALGGQPGDVVAVCLDRSLELIIGVLGAHRARCAYLPIDPGYPAERREVMLNDSRARFLITRENLRSALGSFGGQVLCLDREPEPGAAAVDLRGAPPGDELAYVIYTSGSTGRPKGVMVGHAAIANRVLWMAEKLPLGAEDRVLLKTPFSFDAAGWEIFLPLVVGAALDLAEPEGHRDPTYLARIAVERRSTVLQLVPSILGPFLESAADLARFGALRLLFCGGEALPAALARSAGTMLGVEVCNLYGPTEATIDATFHRHAEARIADDPSFVPIGRPIANVRVHLLDPADAAVPPGMAGELAIAGTGLARGYLERPDLTAERFTPDPWSELPGGRLYRSGDLALLDGEGCLRFLGRVDQQVKVRGVRIELGEIEACLLGHPRVVEAAAVVFGGIGSAAAGAAPEIGSGDPRLVAFAVLDGGDSTGLREFLGERLPEAMVPSSVVVLPSLPRLPNGKIDRRALPASVSDATPPAAPSAAPRSPVEELVAGIWAEALRVERVAVGDDFFALGGHSLIATRVISRVRDAFRIELPVRRLFELPVLSAFAGEVATTLAAGAGLASPPIEPAQRTGDLPLSYAQQRLWFLQELEPESPAYNLAGALRLQGKLDRSALVAALDRIVRRHESLRTVFAAVHGEPVQRVGDAVAPRLPVVDFTAVGGSGGMAPDGRSGRVASQLAAAQARRPFDLATGPLLRLALLRFSAGDHGLLFSLHHIISDGWSVAVFVRELSELYTAHVTGRSPRLAVLPVQYPDFAIWQRNWLSGPTLDRQLAYWRERLAGAPEVINLPTDRARVAAPTYRGAQCGRALPGALRDGLRRLSRSRSVTLFSTLLGGFFALLRRYGAGDDLVVGTTVANRNRLEIEGLIGFFVNTLVLRADLGGDPPFAQVLATVGETVLGAYAHQDLPFDRVVEELQPRRDLSVSPLFQVAFEMDPGTTEASFDLPGLEVSHLPFAGQTAKFDLDVMVEERAGRLLVAAEHSLDILERSTVIRLLGHYQRLLEGAAARPDLRLSDLPLFSAAEQHQVEVEFQGPDRPGYPVDRTLQRLFAGQAARTPGRIAATAGGDDATYADLEVASRRLAGRLATLGAGPGSFVGILAARGLGFLVAMLGVLRAGAAYLPLDPEYPEERLRHMIDDSGVALLIGEQRLLGPLAGALAERPLLRGAIALGSGDGPVVSYSLGIATEIFDLGAREAAGERETGISWLDRGSPRDPAYLLYTSGSTGLPKAAVVRHDGAVNHIWAQLEALEMGEDLCFLQSAPVSSDISVWQFLAPLVVGGRTVIVGPEVVGDPPRLLAALRDEEVTIAELVPAVLRALLDHAMDLPEGERALQSLRWMMATGEAVPIDLIDAWFALYPNIRAVNAYGPTEAADDVVQLTFDGPPPRGLRSLPIGRPLANFRCHVVDPDCRPVPVGVSGELWIAGIGVGSGYWNHPEKTAASFVPDPLDRIGGQALYRTGDLVRWQPDGNLEFLGRIDHQVKIRGFRIELGEIEEALRAEPDVTDCVVVVRDDGRDRFLAAYLASGSPAFDPAPLREGLRTRLPAHMVPTAWVVLPELPRTPNGKVDRRALPKTDRSTGARAIVAPRTPTEARLAAIWSEVLGMAEIDAEADFFSLGGHSLLASRVLARAREAFGIPIALRQIFEHSTLAGLAQAIDRSARLSMPISEGGIARRARAIRRVAHTDDGGLELVD